MILIEAGEALTINDWEFDLDQIIDLADYLASPSPKASVRISPDDDLYELGHLINDIEIIFITFDSFADGRVFSVASQLRQRFKFPRKIIAWGPMIADQYGYALQCGIDAVLIPNDLFERQPLSLWHKSLALLPMKHETVNTAPNDHAKASNGMSLNTRDIAVLNQIFQHKPTEELFKFILSEPAFGRVAVVSSFGADSAALLYYVAKINPATPIIFIDTERHFKETLAYRTQLSEHLGLSNVITVTPEHTQLSEVDSEKTLCVSDPQRCCYYRKVLPLEKALQNYDTWISGRKSHHSSLRSDLPIFESTHQHLKLNPLVSWGQAKINAFIEQHALPKHPLVTRGYTSIGCSPCTEPTVQGEDLRAGRWRDQSMTECGIHFIGGKAVKPRDAVIARG